MQKNKTTPTLDYHRGLRNRMLVLSFFFLLYGAGLSARLFYLQILQHDTLTAQSDKQYLSSMKIYYGRGEILDRNLNSLATNVEVESVYVNPGEVENRRRTAQLLASHLDLDLKKVLQKVSSGKNFAWIKRKCAPKEIEKLKELDLPGVGFMEEHKRFYPKRELAAHAIGFVGLDNQGLAGVEGFHHSTLKGTTSLILMEKDARGRQIRVGDNNTLKKPKTYDVALTIDEVIQFITEHHLKEQVKKHNAKGGMAIVMNPHTGEIYSMVNVPLYNPNNYSMYSPGHWTNSIISGAFEPGSIFKPILAASAIDAGKTKPNDVFFCENGAYKIGKVTIGEATNHKFGWLTLSDIITKSSNIGSIKVGQELGASEYYSYMKKFGFGEKLGIDLPGESKGKLRDLRQWSAISLASLSFGHEIGVTPLQMVTAISAIANGGNLMRPHITKAILQNGKVARQINPEIINRVISENTSRLMTDILKNVVKEGTGTRAAIPGFDVAGKTGTAQKMDIRTQTYSKSAYLSSFIGFVPADSPKLAILVMIDEPQNGYYGGEVAAPVFQQVAKETLRYLNVPSSDERVFILDRA